MDNNLSLPYINGRINDLHEGVTVVYEAMFNSEGSVGRVGNPELLDALLEMRSIIDDMIDETK